MAVTYTEYKVLASGSRVGMVINRPLTLINGHLYKLIIGCPGIGERGTGSDADLERLRVNGSWYAMETRVKASGEYILIEVQPQNNYEHGEINEALAWAHTNFANNINFNKVYLAGLSLGGGGIQQYLSHNATAYTKFAAAALCCPGPNKFFVGSTGNYPFTTAIADAGYANIANNMLHMPCWYFHCIDDTTAPIGDSTNLTRTKVLAINGSVKMARTIYNSGGHTGCWPKAFGNFPAATTSNSTDYNDPTVGVLEFFDLNEIGTAPVMPPRISDPEPPPTPAPPTTKYYIKNLVTTGEPRPQTVAVQLTYTDNTVSPVFKAATNDTITDVFIRLDSGGHILVDINYATAPTLTIGPLKPA